jgi:hypothetical protein
MQPDFVGTPMCALPETAAASSRHQALQHRMAFIAAGYFTNTPHFLPLQAHHTVSKLQMATGGHSQFGVQQHLHGLGSHNTDLCYKNVDRVI